MTNTEPGAAPQGTASAGLSKTRMPEDHTQTCLPVTRPALSPQGLALSSAQRRRQTLLTRSKPPSSPPRAQRAANRKQKGGLQCLGAKFSSALFWVTTFTMFLHPESFRLPARLQCFQLMDSHAYLTTGWVRGLLSSLSAAFRSPQCSAEWPGC